LSKITHADIKQIRGQMSLGAVTEPQSFYSYAAKSVHSIHAT